MKPSASVVKLARGLSWLAAVIILLVPFQAFLTVWAASLAGHYTILRLWKEFLLVPIVLGALYILLADKGLRRRLFSLWLIRLIGVYWLVLAISAAAGLAGHDVARKAMWYGLLVDTRYLVFFAAVLVITSASGWLKGNWPKVLFIPAIIVAAFAILQYLVLPYDFLKHFGYGPGTISPYETINHNLNDIRVASTTRGANPLGAYLIVPVCALAVMFFKERREKMDKSLFGLGLLLALVFSFSRSAWIGAALGVITTVWLSIKSPRVRRTAWRAAAATVIIAAAVVVTLRNNHTFQDVFLHTDSASKAAQSSNQGHAIAFKDAARDIVRQPLGGGVGSAGPQSVYNDQPARIAENYYLQIGQEAGIIGMALFIAINISLGLMLYRRRGEPLALALLAALIGLAFVNLLSHAWEDDTLAYLYWGLAGIALAPILMDRLKVKNGQKAKTTTQTARPIR